MSRKRSSAELIELPDIAPGLLAERHLRCTIKTLKLKQDAGVHMGAFVWDCGIVMAKYFENESIFAKGHWAGRRVLELGSGTGIAGIMLGLLGANITLTDVPDLMSLLKENVQKNQVPNCTISPLPWGSDASSLGAPYETVILSDCVYEDEHFPHLAKSLVDVCDSHTIVYCAYKKRYPEREQKFFHILQEFFDWEQISEDIMPRPYRHGEIFILIMRKKSTAPTTLSSLPHLSADFRGKLM